jgi:NADPH:quinone reductase-like Zn-dependent oxidoreductase
MHAVGVNSFGGPDALEVVELPDPVAGPGQLLVRVHAATVNPTDTYVRNGARAEHQRKDPPPYVPGMDAAGVVEEIGDGVDTDLQVGDHVMAIVLPDGAHGAYSQRLALPAGSVARSPAGSSFAEASTVPMNGLTARLALDLLDVPVGGTVAVTGAAGAFGGYCVQLARADGLRVIADASEADEALVRDLGADVVVRRGDGVAQRILEHAPDGVDGLCDGSVQDEALFPAIRDGGGFAAVRGLKVEAPRGIQLHQVWVRRYLEEQAELDRLRQQVEDGLVTMRVAQTFPMAQAGEAHRLLEAGGIRGRLVIEL